MRILLAGNPELVGNMEDYLKDLENEVLGKAEKLEKVGWEIYSASRSCGWRSRAREQGKSGRVSLISACPFSIAIYPLTDQ